MHSYHYLIAIVLSLQTLAYLCCVGHWSTMYHSGALIVNSGKLLLPALTAAARLVTGVLYIPLAQVGVTSAWSCVGRVLNWQVHVGQLR